MRLCSIAISLALTIGAAVSHAQTGVPKLNLTRPNWTAEDPFSTQPSIRELGNGTVLALDMKDAEVRLLSATGATIKQVGRKGSGPGEYESPTMLIALPHDTTLLLDRDARRYLIVTAQGAVVTTQTFPQVLAAGAERVVAADPQGRLFFQVVDPMDKRTPPSQQPIARWKRGDEKFDTVGFVAVEVSKLEGAKLPGRPNTKLVFRRRTTYGPADDWVVAPSGRIALMHAAPYRVEWLELDGKHTQGAPLNYTPVMVQLKDKLAYEPKGPPFARVYAKAMGPFYNAIADDADNLWVRRNETSGSALRRWDIFSSQGKYLGTQSIPGSQTLLAINKRYVYTARVDADGLRWLERHSR